MNYHDSLLNLFETYVRESEKFEKGNMSAGTRARKALAEISKFVQREEKEIQGEKRMQIVLKLYTVILIISLLQIAQQSL